MAFKATIIENIFNKNLNGIIEINLVDVIGNDLRQWIMISLIVTGYGTVGYVIGEQAEHHERGGGDRVMKRGK